MSKLKGTKKIKRILKNFLAENGFGNFAIEIAPDFAYYHSYDTTEEMHKICFSVIVPSDNGFLENLYRRYKPEFVCDVALISFFHELGHHVTYDFFTEEQHEFFRTEKEYIEESLTNNNCDYIRDLYFGVADEDMATRWAIDYITKNAEKVAMFWTELQKAILNFYKVNNIELEEREE